MHDHLREKRRNTRDETSDTLNCELIGLLLSRLQYTTRWEGQAEHVLGTVQVRQMTTAGMEVIIVPLSCLVIGKRICKHNTFRYIKEMSEFEGLIEMSHSLTHPLGHSFTHPPAHSLFHSLTHVPLLW